MYATNVGANIFPIDLLKLMSFCTGKNLLSKLLDDQPYPRGILSQAWSRQLDKSKLTDYLLLLKQPPQFLVYTGSKESINSQLNPIARTDRDMDIYLMLMEFCSAETNRSLEKLQEMMADPDHRSFSIVFVRLLSILCLVNDRILAQGGDRSSIKWHEFRQTSEKLCNVLAEDLGRSDSEQAKLDTVLASISEVLPDITHFDEFSQQFLHPKFAVSFMARIYKTVKARRHGQSGAKLHESLESMDLDDEFNSQSSQNPESQSVLGMDRDRYSLSTNMASFRSCLKLSLVFISITAQIEATDHVSQLTSEFLQYLNQLSAQDLVISWNIIRRVLSSLIGVKGDEISALFEHIIDVILRDYTFERHEVAQSACLDLLGIFAKQWSSEKGSVMEEIAGDTYEWFINTAIKKGIVSEHVSCGIVDLIFILLQLHGPEFKVINSVPTIYDTVLELIDCELPVRAYVAQKLPRLFDYFTLGEHESIFQVIFQRLPLETNWTEGMAVRLLFLSELGSSWHTLLRRCVYHMFEAAGKVNETKDYAATCVSRICSTLSITNEQELFKVFAPQLLYTWLKESSWDAIPYSVFNYESLQKLLHSIEDEAVAQALIHSDIDGLKLLSDAMERNVGDILMDNLARAAAYSFAADSQRRSTNNTKGICESRLKSFFDSQSYVSLLQAHYPLIISVLFATVKSDEEVSLIKLLTKDSGGIGKVAATLSEIRNFSSSSTQLPADQQPNFRPVFLLENIERLCRRIGRSNETLWSDSLFVFVLRYLLQRIQPSLGSLHACTMLRKIRLLVAIAGKVPFSGYPLEMMLHALQPFLTNHLCTDDAIGIARYLLNPGVGHLPERLPFVTGFVVWNLLSIKRFCDTPHDSTTQESEYRATLSKAEAFRDWLYSSWCPVYVSTLQSMDLNSQRIERFRLLIDTAAKVESTRKTTTMSESESELLKALLLDQQSLEPLLAKTLREAVLALLCAEFEPPTSFREDIFGTDTESVEFALQVWDMSRSKTQISDGFLIWAGRVLGRARNSSNDLEFSKSTRKSIESSIYTLSSNTVVDPDLESVRIILKAIIDVISSNNHNEVGFAEQTLRQIFSRDPSRVNIERQMGSDIPQAYYKGLKLSTGDMPISLPSLDLITWDGKGTSPIESRFWLRDILLSYTSEVKNDLLKSVMTLLSGIQRLSVDLFAPILHLILLEERLKGHPKGVKAYFSKIFNYLFQHVDTFDAEISKTIIRALLYLREQPTVPLSILESLNWLDLDYIQVSRAAELCGMYTPALLFAESVTILNYGAESHTQGRRQSLKIDLSLPNDLLLSIYRNIEEPDSFYGVHQSVDLDSVLELLEYENDGNKSLLFHGARLDSDFRNAKTPTDRDISGVCKALSKLNLNSLALSVLKTNSTTSSHGSSSDMVFRSARKLEQWDISIPEAINSDSAVLFNVFQDMNTSTDIANLKKNLNSAILTELKSAFEKEVRSKALYASFRNLGVLTEIDEVFSSRTPRQIEEVWTRMLDRNTSLPKVQ
jgi:serine-protein kinase ATM